MARYQYAHIIFAGYRSQGRVEHGPIGEGTSLATIPELMPTLTRMGSDGWRALTIHVREMPVYGGSTPEQQYEVFWIREVQEGA